MVEKLGIDFPYDYDETGRCEKLTDENKCSVYDERPDICNVDKMLEFVDTDKATFYELNIASCNKMMDEDNIPQEFRIKCTKDLTS